MRKTIKAEFSLYRCGHSRWICFVLSLSLSRSDLPYFLLTYAHFGRCNFPVNVRSFQEQVSFEALFRLPPQRLCVLPGLGKTLVKRKGLLLHSMKRGSNAKKEMRRGRTDDGVGWRAKRAWDGGSCEEDHIGPFQRGAALLLRQAVALSLSPSSFPNFSIGERMCALP